MSRFVGQVLAERFSEQDAFQRAMTELFARGPYLQLSKRDDGRTIPTRAEINDRAVLR